jgi:hypothetical protein
MTTPRDAVQFTRESADRIAGVVRTLELTPARGAALNFEAVQSVRGGKGQRVFRMCTFTGAWAKNSAKTVTFRGVTSTPNTVSATNLFAAIPAPASSGNCAIAREGTAWYLIAAEC